MSATFQQRGAAFTSERLPSAARDRSKDSLAQDQQEMQAASAIVCVSDLFWDEHWSSEQQLMLRLCQRAMVLYVERPVSPMSFFTRPSDAPIGRQLWRFLRGGLRFESPSLAVLTPPPVLPLRFVRLCNAVNEKIRRRSIRRAMKKLAIQSPVLWIYPPDAGRLVGTLGESLSVYYCADDWGALDQWWNAKQDIRSRESELAAKCDLVVGTSSKIVKRWQTTHPNVLLVTNGADVGKFKMAREGVACPADVLAVPEPRVGFIGFIDRRFDIRLYAAVAKARPDWSFVIVGPFDERDQQIAALRAIRNVYFLGARDRAELPAYLTSFQVCTIPYVRNELSESIFPLKLFEYLAAGRPVVATSLPELKAFASLVRFGDATDTFIAAIQRCLNSPLPRANDSFLEQNSWDFKADVLWERLQVELEARTSSFPKERGQD